MGIIGRDGWEIHPLGEGGFVPVEVEAEDPPLWLGSPAQGLGEQDPKPHTPPPLWGDPYGETPMGRPLWGDPYGETPIGRPLWGDP